VQFAVILSNRSLRSEGSGRAARKIARLARFLFQTAPLPARRQRATLALKLHWHRSSKLSTAAPGFRQVPIIRHLPLANAITLVLKRRQERLDSFWQSNCSALSDLAGRVKFGAKISWESDARKWQPAEEAMLDRCANPQCLRRFLRLGQGRLFLVEAEGASRPSGSRDSGSPYLRIKPRRVERYWLCDQCVEIWTLIHDPQRGISLIPLRRGPFSTGGRSVTKRSA
jgi:hypothetical protein